MTDNPKAQEAAVSEMINKMEQARAVNMDDIVSNMSHLQNPSFANRLQATDSMSNLSKF